MTTETHTVYLHRNEAGRVLYVGCTKDLKVRTALHKSCHDGSSPWWPEVASVEVDSEWPTRNEALARERALIAELTPTGNHQHNPKRLANRRPSAKASLRLNGDTVRLIREQLRGMSQDDLADAAGINRTTVSRYEGNTAYASREAMYRIAAALRVNVEVITYPVQIVHVAEHEAVA